LESGKISKVTYDQYLKERSDETAQKTGEISKEASKIENLINLSKILEQLLSNINIHYVSGEINKKRFERETKILEIGLKSIKKEIERIEDALKKFREKKVTGFYFYEDYGKPLDQATYSLKDFTEKLKVVPVTSIEYHQERGDFSKWIRDVFGDTMLAGSIEKLKDRGETLRKQIIETVTEVISEKAKKEELH